MVKYGHKKEKITKSSLLYIIKTSKYKTERSLYVGKFGLKPCFKKEKTKVLSTRRYRIYVSQIEKLISVIWLPKLKFRVFCRFILQFKKVLSAISLHTSWMSLVPTIISAFNSNLFLYCVFRKRFYINTEPPWYHQTCALYHLQNNLNITIKNEKFQTNFAVKTSKYSVM